LCAGQLTEVYIQVQRLFTAADRVKKEVETSCDCSIVFRRPGNKSKCYYVGQWCNKKLLGTDMAQLLLEENKFKVLPEENIAVTTAKGNDSPKMFKISSTDTYGK
jgi:hypothetical protein